jgi:hypothetical protein
LTPGRARLASAGLLLGTVLVCAAAAECGLRVYHTGTLRGYSGEHTLRMPDDVRGWVLAPDSTSFQYTRDYGVLVRTNSQGLRDREHAPLPAPGSRCRSTTRCRAASSSASATAASRC